MRGRHRVQIIKLWMVALIQIVLVGDNQVSGISMVVGIMIFNIVGG